MKKKINSIVCFILSFCILVSIFTVFIGASNEQPENVNSNSTAKILLNRSFDEGWNYTNGLQDSKKGNNFFIDYERSDDLSYNYFLRLEATTKEDGYLQLLFGSSPRERKHSIIELDLKIDDFCNFGQILYARTQGGMSKGITSTLLSIVNNQLSVFNSKENLIPLSNDWIHVSLDYDYSDEELLKGNQFKINCFVTPKGKETVSFTKTLKATEENRMYVEFFRLGMPITQKPEDREGTNYCVDNLKVYCSDKGIEEIPKDNYGSLVNSEKAKDIEIKTNDTDAEIADKVYLENSVCMKIGVDYALFKNKKRPIYEDVYGAPIKQNGTVMVPLEIILEYIGFPHFVHEDGESFDISTGDSVAFITLGRKVAIVDGKRIELHAAPGYAKSKDGNNSYLVIAMADVEKLFPGYFVTYDDMGLIIISKKANLLNRESDIKTMLNLMKEFIFEYKTGDEFYNDLIKTTKNFTHPYLMTNQDNFDRLHKTYKAKENENYYNIELMQYLKKIVTDAESYYRVYAIPSSQDTYGKDVFDTYIGLKPEKLPINPYPNTKGYDPAGGRLNESGVLCGTITKFAFAYQITRNEKYLKCAYDFAIQMGTWEHWGPAHFLNCADASFQFALALDWIYNDIVELGKTDSHFDINKLIDILYTHGTKQGHYSTVETFGKTLWPRNQHTLSNYTNMTNNWNAVCVSGMAMASLITAQKEEYRQTSMELLSNNFEKLCKNGLGQYAPDGSYVESPGYWSYGTNSLFRMAMVLESACGSDYGLMDCWGIDKTCYFACHTESSDYRIFNYHDSSAGTQDCSSFLFVSKALNDSTLASIRIYQLRGGKTPTFYDMLYYPETIEETDELPLSYVSDGIDAYTVRSSWEKGAMFAGIIGGDNSVSHGQVDSGSWVYHNLGKIWFCDLGSDEYNLYNYFSGDIRYRYYRMNAEGNNCLVITSQPTSVPYGQKLNGSGKIVKYETNDFGSYAIIDNTSVYNVLNKYGANSVSYAKRGMMSTNKGKTVVIQDELSFTGIQSLYWFAHYDLNTVKKVELSSDKRSAYLTDGEENTIRIAIVSKSRDLEFEIMDCYTFVLNGSMGTVDKNYSPSKGGQPEYSRSHYMKLAIKAENTLSFNVAVAIEAIDTKNEMPVGYDWCEMQNWVPSEQKNDTNPDSNLTFRDIPKRSSIKSGVLSLTRTREKNDVYGEKIDSYYRLLTDTEYAYLKFKDENLDGFAEEIKTLETYKNEYDTFVKTSNSYLKDEQNLIKNLFGF